MSMILASDIKQHVRNIDYDGESPDFEPEEKVRRLRTLVLGFVNAGAPIDTLGALHLRFELFAPDPENLAFTSACANLTTFDVHFDRRGLIWDLLREADAAQRQQIEHNLRAFLASLTNLESLSVIFGSAVLQRSNRGGVPAHHLNDVVPLDKVWPRLRMLQIQDVCLTEKDLMVLLSNHASTLRCFHFRNLALYNRVDEFDAFGAGALEMQPEWRKGAWRGVFELFDSMKSLRHGDINEYLRKVKDNQEGWKVRVNDKDVMIKTNLRTWLVDEEE
jgi:hypothetical protein